MYSSQDVVDDVLTVLKASWDVHHLVRFSLATTPPDYLSIMNWHKMMGSLLPRFPGLCPPLDPVISLMKNSPVMSGGQTEGISGARSASEALATLLHVEMDFACHLSHIFFEAVEIWSTVPREVLSVK